MSELTLWIMWIVTYFAFWHAMNLATTERLLLQTHAISFLKHMQEAEEYAERLRLENEDLRQQLLSYKGAIDGIKQELAV